MADELRPPPWTNEGYDRYIHKLRQTEESSERLATPQDYPGAAVEASGSFVQVNAETQIHESASKPPPALQGELYNNNGADPYADAQELLSERVTPRGKEQNIKRLRKAIRDDTERLRREDWVDRYHRGEGTPVGPAIVSALGAISIAALIGGIVWWAASWIVYFWPIVF